MLPCSIKPGVKVTTDDAGIRAGEGGKWEEYRQREREREMLHNHDLRRASLTLMEKDEGEQRGLTELWDADGREQK